MRFLTLSVCSVIAHMEHNSDIPVPDLDRFHDLVGIFNFAIRQNPNKRDVITNHTLPFHAIKKADKD